MANTLERIREEGKDLAATGKCFWMGRARQGRQPLPRTPAIPAADLPGTEQPCCSSGGEILQVQYAVASNTIPLM